MVHNDALNAAVLHHATGAARCRVVMDVRPQDSRVGAVVMYTVGGAVLDLRVGDDEIAAVAAVVPIHCDAETAEQHVVNERTISTTSTIDSSRSRRCSVGQDKILKTVRLSIARREQFG